MVYSVEGNGMDWELEERGRRRERRWERRRMKYEKGKKPQGSLRDTNRLTVSDVILLLLGHSIEKDRDIYLKLNPSLKLLLHMVQRSKKNTNTPGETSSANRKDKDRSLPALRNQNLCKTDTSGSGMGESSWVWRSRWIELIKCVKEYKRSERESGQ